MSKPKIRHLSRERLQVDMPTGETFSVHHNPRMSDASNISVQATLMDIQIDELQKRVALMRKAIQLLNNEETA